MSLFRRIFGKKGDVIADRRTREGAPEDSTLEFSSPYASQREAERVLIAQIRDSGNDPTRPNDVEHFLYFDSEHSANQVAESLSARGYQTQVRQAAGSRPRWVAVAHHELIISEESVGLVRASMEALANENAGWYDGWEASAQR